MKNTKFTLQKFLKLFLICFLIIPCMFAFSACSSKNAVYIVSIEKTDSDGLKDTYTITYSDGSTSEIVITNGKDGKDGNDAENVGTYEMWKTAVEKEEFTGSYIDFLKEVFSVSADISKDVADNCLESVVSIATYNYSQYPLTTGSGLIYELDENGNALILTNFHVACSGQFPIATYNLYLNSSTFSMFEATYVGGSSKYDIAVLKVTESEILKNSNAKPIKIRNTPVSAGETVVAIGNTKNYGISVTKGIISVESEFVSMNVGGYVANRRLLRHDAYISNGSSGGGLFDSNGNLVGITNGGVDGTLINYAIPTDILTAVVDNILENCLDTANTSVLACKTGLSISTMENHPIIKGFAQGELLSNGILQLDDKLTSVTIIPQEGNSKTYTITNYHNFDECLLQSRIGDTIVISAKRGETTVTDSIVVTEENYKAISVM